MEYNFGVGGVTLVVNYNDGRFEGQGDVGPVGLLVHTTSGNDCNTDVTTHIISRKGAWWTDGTCSDDLIHWHHCRWESPEVSYSYYFKLAIRFAAGSITLTNPKVRLTSQGLDVCNVGAIVPIFPPGRIVGGDVPQLKTANNLPGAEQLVNALIDLSFEAVETLVANTIVGETSWLISTVGSAGETLYCLL
jgi:hypothetical protein